MENPLQELLDIRDSITVFKFFVAHHFRKGWWLREQRARCRTCGDDDGMYVLMLRKPDLSARSPTVHEDIIDGYCTTCGDDWLWHSIRGIDCGLTRVTIPEGELPQKAHGESCGACKSTHIVGIWRNLQINCFECRTCGLMQLPPADRVRYTQSCTVLAERLKHLHNEEKRLCEYINQMYVIKDPFSSSP